ncbi:MAG: glycosyltransferase family 4 protein [Nibricoccus sp.]
MSHTIVNDSMSVSHQEAATASSSSNLKVMQVCTSAFRGGAGKAAYRLHRALPAEGVSSRMMVAQRFSRDEETLEYNPIAPAPAALGRFFFRAVRRWHRPSFRKAGAYFTLDRTPIGLRLPSQLPPCDVANLHWVADLFDYGTLPKLTQRVPLVWTFHDMNVFTGGCHYTGSCERYTAQCGKCPQLKTSKGENDMTRQVMNRKLAIMEKIHPARVTIVCPSQWLANEVERSLLCKRFNVHVIPNGIELEDFYPVEKTEARRRLDLPATAKIVLFVAENLSDPRKGFASFIDTIGIARDIPDLLILTLGRGVNSQLTGPAFRHLGELHDLETLRTAYSAADVFANTSLQDNLPNTILESMACGTPVAGFQTGGIGEAVRDGHTGLLAPIGNTAALARAMLQILTNAELRQIFSNASRHRVEHEYTTKLQAARYAKLYQKTVWLNQSLNPTPM